MVIQATIITIWTKLLIARRENRICWYSAGKIYSSSDERHGSDNWAWVLPHYAGTTYIQFDKKKFHTFETLV